VKSPTARGCAGAFIAVVVVAIAMSVPGTMGDMPVAVAPRIETFISAACGGSSPCPSADRLKWAGELEKVLAERMPDLPEGERARLARVIYEEAKKASLDPLFVLALIAVESGFDQVAESQAGARGLMQLRPSTLRREAARSRLEGDPDDPVLNIRAGIRYFVRLLRAFGSTDLALMAYNAGPNRILHYLDDQEGIPDRFQTYPKRIEREHQRLRRKHLPPAQLTAAAIPRSAISTEAAQNAVR
jgi:Transglycosylase SLT domain